MLQNILENTTFNQLFELFDILKKRTTSSNAEDVSGFKVEVANIIQSSNDQAESLYKLALLLRDLSYHYLDDYQVYFDTDDFDARDEELLNYLNNWTRYEQMDDRFTCYIVDVFVCGIQYLLLMKSPEAFSSVVNTITPLDWMGNVDDIELALCNRFVEGYSL